MELSFRRLRCLEREVKFGKRRSIWQAARQILLLVAVGVSPTGVSAYDRWYEERLNSLVLARSVDVSVNVIRTHFFDPIKEGDDARKRARILGEGDAVDKSLQSGGRVPQNIEALLRDKLARELGIQPFARDSVTSAPYKLSVDVSVNQGFDMFGGVSFVATVTLELRERGVGPSGIHGYIETNFFSGVAGGQSKREVEGMVFVALEESWKRLSSEVMRAREHCSANDCSR